MGATSPRWPRKIFSEVDQIALARTLLSIARHNRACLTLHGDKACGADGVHLPAGSDPIASRAMLGPAKLIGVSLHTVTEAEVINPSVVDYAIAGPTFETPSKPGYGPEIGRKGVARIVRAAPVPVLAIGRLNATRTAEVLAAGPVGIAVMGGVMRAAESWPSCEGACLRPLQELVASGRQSTRGRCNAVRLKRYMQVSSSGYVAQVMAADVDRHPSQNHGTALLS